ncbi:RING finger protein 151 [Mobula hypostoma]|uniref:RING finger protein 151 n=1 Tax=Mobula hypostoma TaxID=723540 RepID=UPI002FC33522
MGRSINHKKTEYQRIDGPIQLSFSDLDFGYDVELFVNAPDPEFICTICHGVLKGPVELSCQHVFCKGCISSWLVRKHDCPCCRKKVKGVTRSVIPMIHNMIGRLIMKHCNVSNAL